MQNVHHPLGLESLKQFPCYFIPNAGQVMDPRVGYFSKGAAYDAFFKATEASFTFFKRQPKPGSITDLLHEDQGLRLDFRFLNARTDVEPEGKSQAIGKVNWMKGSHPNQWHTDIPTYHEIFYRELWPCIDLVFRSEGTAIKYEYRVRPSGDLQSIQFTYVGADGLSLDREGNLVIQTQLGELLDPSPVIYQEKEGRRMAIAGSFQLISDEQQSFRIGFIVSEPYDPDYTLIIDPGISFSTYLGGASNDFATTIQLDSDGNLYIAGQTSSANFPVTPGVFQQLQGGGDDAFVTKLNPTGSALIYSTYLGGSGSDSASKIALDAANNVYVIGTTFSSNFPVTPGAIQPTKLSPADTTFVTKLNSTGSSLLYSTYLGGSDSDTGSSIAVDSAGNAYVAGSARSSNFPVTPGAFQANLRGEADAFVAKLNPAGTALLYSTYLGGSALDESTGLTIDASGHAYVIGVTSGAPDFPTTPGAFQTELIGFGNAFISKLNPEGTGLVYSTLLGGSGIGDVAFDIKVDAEGNAYVTGNANNSADFPTTPGAFQTELKGFQDIFVTKLNSAGSALVYSTLVGGFGNDQGISIAIDTAGNAYITGVTTSADFPITAQAFQPELIGTSNAYVTKLNPTGSALVYSSYLGGSGSTNRGAGIVINTVGEAYVTGFTNSANFPVTDGAFQTVLNGSIDGFVTKIVLLDKMSLSKVPDRTDVLTGESVTYFITITNTGEVPLTNIQIADPLIGFTDMIPALAVGEAITVQAPFIVPAGTVPRQITNTVTVLSDQIPIGLTASTTINVVAMPTLIFRKSVVPTVAAPGSTVVFEINASNVGDVAFTNLLLTDSLLGIHETIDQIEVGATLSLSVPYQVPLDAPIGSTIINTAEISGDNLQLMRATTILQVQDSLHLELEKTSDRTTVIPGGTVRFTITLRNSGNLPLTNIVVTDYLIGQNFTVPRLDAGQTETIQVLFLVPLETPPGIYLNSVDAVSDQTPSVTASVEVEVLPSPFIGVLKVPNTTEASAGQLVNYRITIANPGNVALTGIRVTDPLLGIDTAIPDLAIGAEQELSFPFSIPADALVGDEIINILTVISNETGPVQVLSTIKVIARGLSLTKTADAAVAAPGSTINYTMTVTNLLNSPQTNVTLSDPLLGIHEIVPILPAAGTFVTTASMTVPVDSADGSLIRNTFSASSDQTPLQRIAADVVVVAAPGQSTSLSLRKLPDRTLAALGETITYTVEVSNTGNHPASRIRLLDSMTGTQKFIPALAPGQTQRVQFLFTIPIDAKLGTLFLNRVTAQWPERPEGMIAQSDARVLAGLPRFLLQLTNVVNRPLAAPGEMVFFTITVTNNSPLTLTDVHVVHPLTRFHTAIPSMAPGGNQSFVRPFTIPTDAVGATEINGTAYAFSDQTPLQQAQALVTVTSLPNLSLTKTVDRAEGSSGDTVFFTVRFRNTGNIVLNHLNFNDSLIHLQTRMESFPIGADQSIRIPFLLPDVSEDTIIVNRVFVSSDNGPTLHAEASVNVIVDEE
ncbi:DUF7507 domain-containing protein [Paenibacillus protaetiae]|nr:SBBP repeat-containing protein [Paenibacillus protaetiae]